MTTMHVRPGRTAFVLAALAALVGGCVSIPDDGTVQTVEGGRPQQVSPARIRPAGPVTDAAPTEIVNGFLQAMMSSPVRYDIARRFLTEGASDDWSPRASVTVYSQTSVSEGDTPAVGASVDVDLAREAVLTAQGRFTVPDSREQHLGLTLVQEDEQWRIADPPQGALISQSFFESYYDPLNLYFFDSAGTQLVAAPVHLPDDTGRATYLVSSLLMGPQGVLGGQARTFLPETWVLARPVEIDDEGVAVVRFAGSDSGLSLDDRQRLSAQLVASLRQIPTITGVEIRVGDRPLSLPSTPDVQRLDTWNQYDPAADRSSQQLFAMREGTLYVVGRASTSPFAGAWGTDPVRSEDFRVSLDAERIALVTDGRRVVRVSPLAGEPELTAVRQGTNLLRPSWDAGGRLWTIDRTATGSVLTVGPTDKPPRSVDLGILATGQVTGFELSPDEARVVATARVGGRDGLYVGAIRYDEEGTPVGLVDVAEIPVPADTGVPVSAAWRSSTSLAVLARAQQRVPQVSIVAIDSSTPVTGAVRVGLFPQDGAIQVLGPGQPTAPLYVLDTEGGLWTQTADGRWKQTGDDPVDVAAFPG
ncbi:LpqB family beta-propeller domain-containing protein [Mumia qirimensis]|uniref:LpqB family beta-propeller domain-containing protein n=1 Tax=Mumia qirimensis TaxID=3234852 RepID=UPI00351D03E8